MRVFKYGDQTWADPGDEFSNEDVRAQLTQFFPELARATARETKLPDGTTQIEFVKNAGTKGGDNRVPCWMCGELFQPDPDALRRWVESGRGWMPDDWTCPRCERAANEQPWDEPDGEGETEFDRLEDDEYDHAG